MKVAIVTGASKGIGLAVSETLLALGYKVYGLARTIANMEFTHPAFVPLVCDVTDLRQLARAVETIKQQESEIYILVNNAGVGLFGPHEQLSPHQLAMLVQTNLQAPLILTQMVLRELKKTQGFVINISSITAKKISTHGCAYAATKAGLSHFSNSLFEEVRKTGVSVVCLHPDVTETGFYDALDFRPGDDADQYITAQCVADAVETVLTQRPGTVIAELTIRPQRQGIVRKQPAKE